jgi:tetratricopeptide (TPR) repeat protein
VAQLDAQLGNMDQRTVTEDSLVNYESFFQYFLLLSLLLLVIEMVISERVGTKKRKDAAVKLAVFFLVAFLQYPNSATAQDDKAIIKKGNEAYKKNEFDKAAEQYQKVTTKTPANATAQYNLGNALYKNSKTDDAVAAYDNAATNLTDKTEKSKALYNKGVVLQNNKKLPECIAAYKDALKLNPQDEDARQNLQKALQQLKQQQQKENKDQKKPKEDQKKKEEQKKKEDEKKQQQPQQQQPKITKKDAEEKLKALLQQEKNLQDKLKRVNAASPNKPEKDW